MVACNTEWYLRTVVWCSRIKEVESTGGFIWFGTLCDTSSTMETSYRDNACFRLYNNRLSASMVFYRTVAVYPLLSELDYCCRVYVGVPVYFGQKMVCKQKNTS